MAKLEWHQAVKVMLKNVVKVSTLGNGYGSGVIVPTPRNAPGNCCVLTAYHVIQKAEETGATIEIELAESQEKYYYRLWHALSLQQKIAIKHLFYLMQL